MNTLFLICSYGEKNLFPKKMYQYHCRNTKRSVNILIVIGALITAYINFCISFGFRETSVINCSLIESIMPFLVVLSVNVIAANIFRFFLLKYTFEHNKNGKVNFKSESITCTAPVTSAIELLKI